MTTPVIELIYFAGCPHLEEARRTLAEALAVAGRGHTWLEWDLGAENTPVAYRRFGSPTVLIDGEDVGGPGSDSAGPACRAGGAPPASAIIARLRCGSADAEE